MDIRIGLPKTTGGLPQEAERLRAPALISANGLWDPKLNRFRLPGSAILDLDVALDCGGFVAMKRYNGYRWPLEKYVELAGSYSWSWWASMDFCCEPEIAADQAEIDNRIHATWVAYNQTCLLVESWRRLGAEWLTYPMPVLQGRRLSDYLRSYDLTVRTLPRDLMGLGSVCRRDTKELVKLVRGLDASLPKRVKLHLFGVKGDALPLLEQEFGERIASTDSAAWDDAARRAAFKGKYSNTIAHRRAHMRTWYERQLDRLGLEPPPPPPPVTVKRSDMLAFREFLRLAAA
jgi:hypothetical protein